MGGEISRQINEHVVCNVSVEEVIEGVQRLKLGMSGGEDGLNSYHIIHGPRILYLLLIVCWYMGTMTLC